MTKEQNQKYPDGALGQVVFEKKDNKRTHQAHPRRYGIVGHEMDYSET